MWFPVEHAHRAPLKLFAPRFEAERGAEWYVQSSAAATLKSISLGVLLREELRRRLDGSLPALTTEPSAVGGRLTLYEAFVVGRYKVLGTDVSDETDALLAAMAWGAVHRGFALPSSLRARTLHRRGTRMGPAISVWETIWGSMPISGSADCDVVAIERRVAPEAD